MIELSYDSLFILYLCFTLSSVIGVWIISHHRRKKRIFFSSEEALRVCEYCHFAYLENSLKTLNRCPQCKLFNKENTYKETQNPNNNSHP
jgi:hypothetical protein